MRKRRFPIGDRIGWCGIILIAIMLAPSWPGAALTLVLSVAALQTGLWLNRRAAERRRLASDATVEHQALMNGSDRLGTFGRYQPPLIPGGEVIIPPTPWPFDQKADR